MGLREYKDSKDRDWKVWDVPPRFSPKRSGLERRSVDSAHSAHSGPERRQLRDRRRTVPPVEWVHGWICFQGPAEKRRLCPPPDDWEQVAVEELERYFTRAVPVASIIR